MRLSTYHGFKVKEVFLNVNVTSSVFAWNEVSSDYSEFEMDFDDLELAVLYLNKEIFAFTF
jgi:hypothetical protein